MSDYKQLEYATGWEETYITIFRGNGVQVFYKDRFMAQVEQGKVTPSLPSREQAQIDTGIGGSLTSGSIDFSAVSRENSIGDPEEQRKIEERCALLLEGKVATSRTAGQSSPRTAGVDVAEAMKEAEGVGLVLTFIQREELLAAMKQSLGIENLDFSPAFSGLFANPDSRLSLAA